MRDVTRRSVLASAGAAAATALTPVSGLHPAVANAACLRSRKEFLDEVLSGRQLTGPEREKIVKQGIKLIQDFYVHLPHKQKLYGATPIESLQKLLAEAPGFTSDPPFHARMSAIFTELRDLHAQYSPPSPYSDAHAFLPFKVEACAENGQRKYIVSRVAPGFEHPTFRPGVEIVSWDGVPIEQAAERVGGEGATSCARQALGLARLTYRTLALQPLPEQESALVRYRAGDKELDVEASWRVLTLPEGACSNSCNEVQQLQDFRKFLFRPYDPCNECCEVSGRFTTPDGVFGYIRIFSFDVQLLPDDKFVPRFKETVASFADTKGLIIDVRDNGGGSIRASERILQWIVPKPEPIEPCQFYFRATNTTLDFCQLSSVGGLGGTPEGLGRWVPSLKQALQTGGGASFSDAFEYTNKELCNLAESVALPRPVIVVTNALTYSAAEMFAAGFQDHGGTILGVDETTGGGGAHRRWLSELSDLFKNGSANGESPYEDLPNDTDFLIAFRRSKRVGLGKGKEIEDAGVQRNLAYDMTRNDLLNNNEDLKNHAAKLLVEMK